MAGTILGGRKAAATMTARDPDFYKRIGGLGGRAPYTGLRGFAANRERARIAGAKGGTISRKPKKEV